MFLWFICFISLVGVSADATNFVSTVDSNEFERNFTIVMLTEAAKKNENVDNTSNDDLAYNLTASNLHEENKSDAFLHPESEVTVNPFGDFENPFYSMQILPANATVFELVKAQIYADFKPFLILIPEPVKRFIRSQVLSVSKSSIRVLSGAMAPMTHSALQILLKVGEITVGFGQFVIFSAQSGLSWLESQTKERKNNVSVSLAVVQQDVFVVDSDLLPEEDFTSSIRGENSESRYTEEEEEVEGEYDEGEESLIEI